MRAQNFRLREDWSRQVSCYWWPRLLAPTPCWQGTTEDDPEAHPPSKPPLSFVPLLPAVFTLCLFLSHLFSLFFQKRKSSSSVQLMVSVCRLPNAGKCWASTPCSCLPPAGCTGNPGRGEGAQGVLGTCASCDNVCVVCACCWRVSVDTSNPMAQTSSLTVDLRTPSGMKVDLNPIPHPALGFSLPPGLCSGAHLRAWLVPVAVRVEGLGVAKAAGAVEALLEQGYTGPAGGRGATSPCLCLNVPVVAWWPMSLFFWFHCCLPQLCGFSPPEKPSSLTLGLPLSLSSSPANVCIPSPFCGHHVPLGPSTPRHPSQLFQKGQGFPCIHPSIHAPAAGHLLGRALPSLGLEV